ncbi:hypothetical protein MHSWG343_05480 [Candidatus Mycoplasma haematohominis]|uniref:Uncharacterized protein n=1 Tax=Candidatus Mycoplasma haematohominis TaxID=1494318 RepID=A0A478FQ25_9MOLU|nr:hypothetical protein MHSWG343_05480 [Candidatus Mycoplasma haemohominis]
MNNLTKTTIGATAVVGTATTIGVTASRTSSIDEDQKRFRYENEKKLSDKVKNSVWYKAATTNPKLLYIGHEIKDVLDPSILNEKFNEYKTVINNFLKETNKNKTGVESIEWTDNQDTFEYISKWCETAIQIPESPAENTKNEDSPYGIFLKWCFMSLE